jgi:SAM-dependent methyltransferase
VHLLQANKKHRREYEYHHNYAGNQWSEGPTERNVDGRDYDRFSRYMEQGARIFYEQLDVPAGCQLLDVACGSGQVALWAARYGVNVTGVDIAPNLVQRAQARAKAEGLNARFREGDAEALPFEDASFDVVTSLVGAMFAPRPELVARELLRVCSPGGTIAMGNWTREGFIGQMFKTFAKFIAPSGMPAPVLWGDEAVVRERLGQRSFRPYDDASPI